MTRTLPSRFAAFAFAAAAMLMAWLPTLAVPVHPDLAMAPVAVELA